MVSLSTYYWEQYSENINKNINLAAQLPITGKYLSAEYLQWLKLWSSIAELFYKKPGPNKFGRIEQISNNWFNLPCIADEVDCPGTLKREMVHW